MKSVNRGFTLVEVMVALLVVGLALPALLSQISGQAEGTADLRDRTFAQWVAQNQLERFRLDYQLNEEMLKGEASGEVEMLDRNWHWKVISEQTDFPGMWRQTVTVGSEPDETLVSLVGFLKEHVQKSPKIANGSGNG